MFRLRQIRTLMCVALAASGFALLGGCGGTARSPLGPGNAADTGNGAASKPPDHEVSAAKSAEQDSSSRLPSGSLGTQVSRPLNAPHTPIYSLGGDEVAPEIGR